ncbi:MAG: hypothetical protein JEZ03_02915 [Bacteroidales bacterium]|nr:hypothetical protein [Bacteroidales bacterium]
MIFDLLIIVYIMALMPLIYECEKLPKKGLIVLLFGIVLTPVIGYPTLYAFKKKFKRDEELQLKHS